jgi:hypothetical protein
MGTTGQEQDNEELSFKDFKKQAEQLRVFIRMIAGLLWRSIRRYAIVYLLLLAGFLAFGYYQYKAQKSFTAKASYIYSELPKKIYGEMMDKLQDMVKSGSYNQVARSLNMPPGQVRAINDISAQNIYGSRLSEDVTEDNKTFYITVSADNNTVFDTLQPAIENYLNSNVLAVQTMTRKRTILEQKIAYLKTELVLLDSLKKAYTQSLSKSSAVVSATTNPFNPVELYEKSEKINHDIADMESLLVNYKAVQVQDSFLVRESPYQKSLPSYLVKYGVYFLITSLLLIFIQSIFKK